MSEQKKDASISSGWYLLGGMIAGVAAGLLLAPKKGSETREDLGEWGRRGREKTRSLLTRIGASLPARVKAAAAIGAVKGGAVEAYGEALDGAKKYAGT